MLLRTENNAEALVTALLDEGEDPKDFLKRTAPGIDAAKGNHHVAAYELEDIGIDNCQYFQGRGTSHTDWTEVYVGVGDNPAEAISDALDAASNGWMLPDSVSAEADAWPEEPSVAAQLENDAKESAEGQLDRADYEDDESYSEAVEELAGEIMSEGESDLYYHAAIWLREPEPGKPVLTAHQESEDPKSVLRRMSAEPMAPSTWPKIPRWQKYERWGHKRERRRGFYMATRYRSVPGPGDGFTRAEPYQVRKGLKQTRFYRDRGDQSHWIEYYNTNILVWDRWGNCTVNNGGYNRRATRDRMNQFLPHSWRIHTYHGTWYWFNNQWPENIRDRLWADQAARRAPAYPWWIPYNNDDIIKSDGSLAFGGRPKSGLALPNGALKTEQDAALRPVPVGPQTMPRRARRDPYGRDPNQLRFQLEGKYLRNLDHWKRVKGKHERLKEVNKLKRELERVDKPDNRKKPKKGHQNIR